MSAPDITHAGLTPRQAEIARLYAAGWQVPAIAQKLGIGNVHKVHQCAYRLRRRGVAVPRLHHAAPPRKVDYLTYARDARAGLTVAAIAARHGVSQAAVSRALNILRDAGADVPPRRRTSARHRAEYAAIAHEVRAGASISDVARRRGIDRSTVQRALAATTFAAPSEPRTEKD